MLNAPQAVHGLTAKMAAILIRRFDVRTGELISGPIAEDIPVHQVRMEWDKVYVKRIPNAL